MDRHISISRFVIHALIVFKHPAQISLASPAGQIGVVDWRRNAHADCSLAVKVAQAVRQTLELTYGIRGRLSEDLV